MIIHAGLLATRVGGLWRGALITGPSGAGKSDLALRLIDQGFVLVADDRTVLWTSGGGLYGRAPDSLAGLIEARGLGVITAPIRDFVQVNLVVECVDVPLERMPEPREVRLLDRTLPQVQLIALEASAPAKLSRALLGLG